MPYGTLPPTDPATATRRKLAAGASRSRGARSRGALHRPEAWDSDVAAARRVASLVQAMGARHLIYLPEGYRDQQGNFIPDSSLEPDDWKRLVSRASEIGRMVLGEYGVRLVFHSHADSHVGTQEEVARFLEETDPSAVSLCLDTGHISYCGGDNLALIEDFPYWIGYVHFKQVAPDVLAQALAQNLGFAEAVRMGVHVNRRRGSRLWSP